MGSDSSWYTSGDATGDGGVELLYELGTYRVLSPIGRGGMGIVYEAEQAEPRRRVAVKVFRGITPSEEQLSRFKAEAQRLSELRHPYIAHIFEGGTHVHAGSMIPYYVLELVPNARSITSYAEFAQLRLRQRIELFTRVCEAVQHAHDHGIVHCDLKPDNILVDSEGRPQLIDLGISRSLGSDEDATSSASGLREGRGTLPYLSPEQCNGPSALPDCRSDVYALGVVLYELLTESLPYDVTGLDWTEAAQVIRNSAPAAPSHHNSAIDASIDAIVLKALEKDAGRRYESAAALAGDLRRVLEGDPPAGVDVGYVFTAVTKLRKFAWKQWPMAVGIVALIMLVISSCVGGWLERKGARNTFERAAIAHVPFVPSAPFENVRIVALTDSTDLEAIVRNENLEDFSASVPTSYRLLHGRALEKIAPSGARAVACDLFARTASQFDDAFIRGIQALRSGRTPVVIAVPGWSLDADGRPQLSPSFQEHGRWGCATGHVGGQAPWSANLLLQRRGSGALPSLVLATLAELRGDGAPWTAEFGLQRVEVHYSGRGATAPLVIPITHLEQLEVQVPQFGIEADDFVGQYVVQVPDDAAMRRSMLDYNELFAAEPDALRRELAGKVVVIADLRPGRDGPFPYPDGRWLPGSFLHAAAIEQVLQERTIRRLIGLRLGDRYIDMCYLLELIIAVAGTLIGVLWLSRRRRAVLCVVAGLIAGVVASVAAFRVAGLLLSPFSPAFVFLVSIGSVVMMGRLRQPRMS